MRPPRARYHLLAVDHPQLPPLLLRPLMWSPTADLAPRDCMDNEDEEDIADEAEETNGMVVVSTIIGARTVTLNTVWYTFIRSAVRRSKMHCSDIIPVADIPITPEVEKNQTGRIACVRT